jgi:hypothetical protein
MKVYLPLAILISCTGYSTAAFAQTWFSKMFCKTELTSKKVASSSENEELMQENLVSETEGASLNGRQKLHINAAYSFHPNGESMLFYQGKMPSNAQMKQMMKENPYIYTHRLNFIPNKKSGVVMIYSKAGMPHRSLIKCIPGEGKLLGAVQIFPNEKDKSLQVINSEILSGYDGPAVLSTHFDLEISGQRN